MDALENFHVLFYILQHDVNVFPIEGVESRAVWKFVINHVTNARHAHFAPCWRRMETFNFWQRPL